MIEMCLINKTWLIEYNWLRLPIRIMCVLKLINNKGEIVV